jgi:hypothetical protein
LKRAESNSSRRVISNRSFLGTEDSLFVIAYHDEHRHGENLPSTAVDAYSVGSGHGIPNRIVHQFIQ